MHLPQCRLKAVALILLFVWSCLTIPVYLSRPRPTSSVAVCLSGSLRSFHHPAVRTSISEHVVSVLRDHGHLVHVFLHIPNEDAKNLTKGLPVLKATSHPTVLRDFHPVHLSTYSVNTSEPCPVLVCPTVRHTVCPYSLIRAHGCMQAVQKYEELRFGRQFEWIYHLRPDVAILSNISLPSSLNRDAVTMNSHIFGTSEHIFEYLREKFPDRKRLLRGRVGDLVMVVHRSLADTFFDAWKAFYHCGMFNIEKGTINPEVALTYWLVAHNIPFEMRRWLWVLVRPNGGPECEKVKYIGRNRGEIKNMEEVCQTRLNRTYPQQASSL